MPNLDPLAPDAPTIALLLSLRATDPTTQKLVTDLSPDELHAYIRHVRTIVQQPVSLKAAVAREAKPRATAKKSQAELDFLASLQQ